jgi:hypothetical protein
MTRRTDPAIRDGSPELAMVRLGKIVPSAPSATLSRGRGASGAKSNLTLLVMAPPAWRPAQTVEAED